VVVPGPENRQSFFDAQVRRRRASWWFTALSALAIVLMGIPLSAVLSPLLYAAALVLFDVVNVFTHVADLLPTVARDSGQQQGPASPLFVALSIAALVLPGSLALLFSWLGVRRLFHRAGSGGTVLALGARPPRTGDLEEEQVANVVGEMATAAGVPEPKVMLLDSAIPNAAAVGSRIDDATIVVTTGLLRTLDRDETQGVVAHLVASVGNGDLRIGATISSVFQTLGLVGSVLRAPSEGAPRVTLRRLLRYAFRRPGADDAGAMAELLTKAGGDWEVEQDAKQPSGVKSMLLLPFIAAGGAFMMTSMVFGWLVVNPFLRRGWRARRYLADASAVEMTRNPDGLACALARLAQGGDVVPGTEWAAHLFVVSTPRQPSNDQPMTSFHPTIASRVERLNAMGASVEVPSRGAGRAGRRATVVFLAVTSPCWVAVFGLMIAAVLALTMVSLMIDALFLAPMVAVLHGLLRHLAGG
jgi:Zn-dependent protease with chaperone function